MRVSQYATEPALPGASLTMSESQSAIGCALPGASAVIVNYRTPELVAKCVRSLLAHGIVPMEAICVVDNGSNDGSVERIAAECPGVQLIKTENHGFGHGVNMGVRATTGELVLVLNPDTAFVDQSIEKVAKLLKDPAIGIAGLDLRNPDGTRQWSARRFYSVLDVIIRRSPLKRFGTFRRRNDRHLMTDGWKGHAFDADWVIGTGFVVRRAAFNAVKGMDTRFFLYMEDVDLCLRVRRAGWRVVAAVGSVLIHDHQRASAGSPVSVTALTHLRSLAWFIRKHGMRVF